MQSSAAFICSFDLFQSFVSMSGLKVLCLDPTGAPAWGFYNSLLVRGSVGVKAKLLVVEHGGEN